MSSALKYIVDSKGHKTSVLVPVKTWEDMTDKYEKLKRKLTVLTGIQEGIREVKEGKNLQTLSDFLSESNS